MTTSLSCLSSQPMSKSAMKKAAKQALKPKKEKDPNWWVCTTPLTRPLGKMRLTVLLWVLASDMAGTRARPVTAPRWRRRTRRRRRSRSGCVACNLLCHAMPCYSISISLYNLITYVLDGPLKSPPILPMFLSATFSPARPIPDPNGDHFHVGVTAV